MGHCQLCFLPGHWNKGASQTKGMRRAPHDEDIFAPRALTTFKLFLDFQGSTACRPLHLIHLICPLWSRLAFALLLGFYPLFCSLAFSLQAVKEYILNADGLAWQNGWNYWKSERQKSLCVCVCVWERERERERERSLQDADCDKGLVGHKNPILPGESSSHQWIFYSLSDCVAQKDFF